MARRGPGESEQGCLDLSQHQPWSDLFCPPETVVISGHVAEAEVHYMATDDLKSCGGWGPIELMLEMPDQLYCDPTHPVLQFPPGKRAKGSKR